MAHHPGLRSEWGDRLLVALTSADRHTVVPCLGMDARGLEISPELVIEREGLLPAQVRVGGAAPRFYAFKTRVGAMRGGLGGILRLEFVEPDPAALRDVARAATERGIYRGPMPEPPPSRRPAPTTPPAEAPAGGPREESIIERARAEHPLELVIVRFTDETAARVATEEALSGTVLVCTQRRWPVFTPVGLRLEWPDGGFLDVRGHVSFHGDEVDGASETLCVGVDLDTLAPPIREELERRGA